MGVSSQDIFGGASGAHPALPGSYGEAPAGFRLPDQVRLGAVHLQVSDLARSEQWYTEVLGLLPTARTSGTVALGAAGTAAPLVVLEYRPRTRPVPPGAPHGL